MENMAGKRRQRSKGRSIVKGDESASLINMTVTGAHRDGISDEDENKKVI